MGGGPRRAGGPGGRCMGGPAARRSSGGQRTSLARGSTDGRKNGLRVRGGAAEEGTEEEGGTTVDGSSLRPGDRDAGNCTCRVHDPQQLAARAVTINQRSAECSSGTTAHNDKQVGIFSRDSSNLIPRRRQGVAMVVGCTDGQKNGLAAQTLTGGQQNGSRMACRKVGGDRWRRGTTRDTGRCSVACSELRTPGRRGLCLRRLLRRCSRWTDNPPTGGGGGDGDGDSGSGGGDDGKCDGKFGGRGAGEGCLWGVRTTQ